MSGSIKINGATSGSTTITAPDSGSDETIELSTALASKLDLAGGKILQVVRATDSTDRTTTSTSYVDASISVTITPQKSDSAILLIWSVDAYADNNQFMRVVITDNSNNAIAGSQTRIGTNGGTALRTKTVAIGYATPATTSATTYKGRFRQETAGTAILCNSSVAVGQLYAIEVSA